MHNLHLTRDAAVEVTIPFPSPEELYVEYGGDDGIDRDEFGVLLGNIDGFGNVAMGGARMQERIQEYIDTEFEAADLNHDGVMDADEFTLYYFKEICFKFPVGKNGYNPGATMYNIFCNYCSYGRGGKRCEEMQSHQLLKLCKDCGLLDKVRCRKADVDLVFHRARADSIYARIKGAAKLHYQQFLHALMLIAEKRQSGFCEVTDKIRSYGMTCRAASMADFLVMHDQPGLAEDSRDLERPRGLPKLRRNLTGQLGTVSMKFSPLRDPASRETTVMRMPSAAQGIRAETRNRLWGQAQESQRASLDDDLVQHPGGPGVSWEQAEEPRVGTAAHGGTGVLQGGTGTQAGAMHDSDVAAAPPGPGKDRKKWDFDQMARSFYDNPENARVTAVIQNPCTATLLRRETDTPRQGRSSSRMAVLQDSEAMHRVRLAQEEQLTLALKYVFEQYNRWEGGVNSSRMDKSRFHKVIREIHILRPGSLNPDQADTVFLKIKPDAQRTINFVQFLEGLRHCAMLTRLSLNEIVQRIVALGGPVEIVYK